MGKRRVRVLIPNNNSNYPSCWPDRLIFELCKTLIKRLTNVCEATLTVGHDRVRTGSQYLNGLRESVGRNVGDGENIWWYNIQRWKRKCVMTFWMMTSWHGYAFRISGPLLGESNGDRCKQSSYRWFETILHGALWCQFNGVWRHMSDNFLNWIPIISEHVSASDIHKSGQSAPISESAKIC